MITSHAPSKNSVFFLHEFLGGSVWGPLLRALPSWLRAVTLDLEPIKTFSPAAWAKHIESSAREAVKKERFHLTVSTGIAASAAAGLVNDNIADRAILINPDPTPLLGDPEYISPGLEDVQLQEFFQAMEPYHEQLLNTGNVPDEGIRIISSYSIEQLTDLTPEIETSSRTLASTR